MTRETNLTPIEDDTLTDKIDPRRLEEISETLSRLVRGDLETRFTSLDRYGAEGPICSSVNDFVDKVETFFREATGRLRDFADGKAHQRIDPRGFEQVFLETIQMFNRNLEESDMRREQQKLIAKMLWKTIEVLDTIARNFTKANNELSNTARLTLLNADVVSDDARHAMSSVQDVAESCEELDISIAHISDQVEEANSTICQFVEYTQEAGNALDRLRDSSSRLDDIANSATPIALGISSLSEKILRKIDQMDTGDEELSDIASQARSLAGEASERLRNIDDKVNAARADVAETAKVIDRINATVESISHFSQAVATATREQSDSTSRISKSLRSISQKSCSISEKIDETAEGAKLNSQISNIVSERVAELVRISSELRKLADELDR